MIVRVTEDYGLNLPVNKIPRLRPNIKSCCCGKTGSSERREREPFFLCSPFHSLLFFSPPLLRSAVVCPDLAASMAHPSWAA